MIYLEVFFVINFYFYGISVRICVKYISSLVFVENCFVAWHVLNLCNCCMCISEAWEFSLRHSILFNSMKLSLLVSFKSSISSLVFCILDSCSWRLKFPTVCGCVKQRYLCLGSAVFEHLLFENRNREKEYSLCLEATYGSIRGWKSCYM